MAVVHGLVDPHSDPDCSAVAYCYSNGHSDTNTTAYPGH